MEIAEINNNNYPVVRTLTELLPPPIIDEAGGGIVYYGWAPLRTPEDKEQWKIMRVNKVGNITKSEFPNSDDSYSFKWSDRATLTYSR